MSILEDWSAIGGATLIGTQFCEYLPADPGSMFSRVHSELWERGTETERKKVIFVSPYLVYLYG